MTRRQFLSLAAAPAPPAILKKRTVETLRRHLDLLLTPAGGPLSIKGKDAAALTAMSFEVLHGIASPPHYRRAALSLADQVLTGMKAQRFGVLPIKEKEKGEEKFIGGGPPALGWYTACLAYVYRHAGNRTAELRYLGGVLDRFPWNPEGYWASTINVASGEPKFLDKATPVNKNASMAMACGMLSEYLRPLDATLAAGLRAKTVKCLESRILPAQRADGYWHYGLTGRDPKNKEVLGYFMLTAGLLIRLKVCAPSYRTPGLSNALAKAAAYSVKELGPPDASSHFDPRTDPRRAFDLGLILMDGGHTVAAQQHMNAALDNFPLGGRGQDSGRAAHDAATVLLLP